MVIVLFYYCAAVAWGVAVGEGEGAGVQKGGGGGGRNLNVHAWGTASVDDADDRHN